MRVVVGWAVGILVGLTACAPPAPTCGPSNCAEGCCTEAGACERGDGVSACGRGGQQCVACMTGQTCRAGACGTSSAGGGAAGGSSSTGGGGGSTTSCSPATCAGCCTADDRCVQPPNNVFNATCGSGGALCADCTASRTVCDGMRCVGATGGGTAGGASAGGAAGGSTAGGAAGGSSAGGAAGGSSAGGSAGGATAGGAAGGSSAGGSAGGSTAGGAAGGSAAGGSAGGASAGGTAGGSSGGSAGGASGGGAAGGSSMPSNVTGTITTRFRLADGGTTTAPVNVSQLTFAAHVNDGFTWTSFPGSGQANGAFTIPQVPAGPYVLQIETDFFEAGSTRQFPVVLESFGRPNATPAMVDPTSLTVSTSMLSPWNTTTDDLNLWIPNQGALVPGYQAVFLPAPTTNATSHTSIVNWTLYSALFGVGLVNSAQGDLVSALQTRQTVSGGLSVSTVVAAGALPAFTQTDGQARSIASVLSTPPSLLRTLQWNTTSFSSQLPSGNMPTHRLQVVTYPVGGIAEGYPVTTATLTGTATPPTSLTIAHPFVNVWAHWAQASYAVTGTRLIPGTTSGSFIIAGAVRREPLATFFPTVAANLGPVRTPTINGQALTVARTGVGLEPFVAWMPPTLGTPNRYEVLIAKLGPNPQNVMETIIESSVTYYTTATGFRVPPGAMSLGTRHLFQISAIADPATSYPAIGLPPNVSRSEAFILSETVVP
ncbi:MAG: hypothetical protein SFW67_36760 [Myxococcaceae bacterium]|nr:hypothetical protein [Myxococcaceae bacterium]